MRLPACLLGLGLHLKHSCVPPSGLLGACFVRLTAAGSPQCVVISWALTRGRAPLAQVGQVKHMVSVRQRPHLLTFLEHVARRFEVVVFTASQRVYAEQLLNVIDPRRAFIRHRVYRESCVFWEGNYLKDLTGESVVESL